MKSKERKRQEAIERQERYNKLTIPEKIDKLNDGGFRADKQRKRLAKLRKEGK